MNKLATTDKPAPPVLARGASLPPEVTARLLANIDVISRRMARQLADDLPLTPEFRRIGYLRAVISACRDGVRSLLHQLHDGRKPRTTELLRLGSAGARQAELGVPLEVLLAAYRLAAKIVWQEVIAEAIRMAELPPQTVVAVTGEVLEYLDEISAAVGQAYLETRERLMRQRDRERDRLLRLLLAGEVDEGLRRLASAHGLELQPPYRVVACALSSDGEPRLPVAWRESGTLLVADEPGVWIALLRPDADPAAFAAALPSGGEKAVCGVGPVAQTLGDIAAAVRRARQALQVGRTLHPQVSLHDDTAVGIFGVLAGTAELRSYVNACLGPVLALPPARRGDLLATLEALVTQRSLGDAAAALQLHRHTLVYRQQRLREVLVQDLDDPLVRHRIWLALQGLRLLDATA